MSNSSDHQGAYSALLARIDRVAGKTMLPGETGFVLQNFRTEVGTRLEFLVNAKSSSPEIGASTLRDARSFLEQMGDVLHENAHNYVTEVLTIIDLASADAGEMRRECADLLRELSDARTTLSLGLGNDGDIARALQTGDASLYSSVTALLSELARRLERISTSVLVVDRELGNVREFLAARSTLASTDAAGTPGATGTDSLADADDEHGETDAADEPTERDIPRPPKTGNSRKRPCRKQGGRKEERRRNDRGHNVKERKLNQYALDPITGLVTSVRPGQEITRGSRVIEQPAGNPKPSIMAFYDATLLPSGSTVVARWGHSPAELDKQLVGRAGRLAKLAGYGDQARSTMFDQIARCANPGAALEAFVLELGGTDALTAEPGTLTTAATRETLPDAVLRAVNAGNEKLVELAENLPVRLNPEKRLADALEDLPGMVESLEEDGNGSILRVRGIRFEDKAVICEKLRDAGGRHVDVTNTRIEKDGRTVKAYVVSAHFNVSAIEIAAARTGRAAEVSYRVDETGTVNAEYGVDLYGTRVTTPSIPCEPSWASVETLVKELERRGDEHTTELLAKLSIEFDVPTQALTAGIGPVRTLEQAREAISRIRAEDLMTEGYADEVSSAAREIRATDGRRVPVEYRGGAAVLAEFSFHPTDIRPSLLPGNVLVGEEEIPTRVRRVRFETKQGSNRPRVIVEETEVTELVERHDAYLEGKDPKKALLTEVRENFIAEATRSMTTALVSPSESLADARNPEAVAKSRVISKHLDPYAAEGGDLVHLVEVLAARAGDEAWSRWCRENVKAFRDQARERRKQRREPATEFFSAVGAAGHARSFLIEAGAALLANRLGRDVTTEEFVDVAREARVTKEHVFTAIDRGRALAQYVKRNG